MKAAWLTLLWLGLMGSRAIAREFDYCYAYEQEPYLLMGTKTAYQFVQGRSRLQPVPSTYLFSLALFRGFIFVSDAQLFMLTTRVN